MAGFEPAMTELQSASFGHLDTSSLVAGAGVEPVILQTHAVGAIRVSQKLRRPAYETGGGIPFHSPAIFFIGTPGLEPGT